METQSGSTFITIDTQKGHTSIVVDDVAMVMMPMLILTVLTTSLCLILALRRS